jgi:polysaccharide export outer membrane protein
MAASRRPANRRVWILALAALTVSGCAQGRLIKATRLPADALVPHTQNAQTVDLSKLVSSSASSELIDRGDVLELTIESGYEQERTDGGVVIRVAEDGSAQVPMVGRVEVAGLELTGAEQSIRAAAIERGVFRNPSVTLLMKQQRMNKVTVVGAVKEPGSYELPRANSALLAALIAAGGFSDNAGTEIEIRRPALRNEAIPSGTGRGDKVAGGSTTHASYDQPAALRPTSSVRIDLIAATKETAGSPDWYLDDGDVVMVEKRDPQPVQVIGLVGKPGQFPLPANKDMRLLDVLAMAGGVSTPYLDKVNVIRHQPGQNEPLIIRVSLREAKTKGKGNFLLGPGDIVSVEQTGPNFVMDMYKTIAPYAFSASLISTLPGLIK